MSLRRKLFLALVIPALLIGLVGGVGVWSVHHLEQAAGRILSENYVSIQAARRMERALRQLELAAATEGCGGGPAAAAARQRLTAEFEAALRVCEGNVTEEGEHLGLARIRQGWATVPPQLGGAPGTSCGPASPALHEAIDALATLNERTMFAEEARTRDVAGLMLASVAGFLVAALVALAVFALLSANRIAEQQRRVVHLQEQLALVMSEVREGLVLLDGAFRVVAVNRVGRRILTGEERGGEERGAEGLAGEALEGRRLDALGAPGPVHDTLAPLMAGGLRAERDLGELTVAFDGAPRVYRPRVLPLHGAAGVEGYLLLFWDVTEQRELEESRRRFISMLSHELKTPMTSLSLAVGLLREQLPDVAAPQQELLDIAGENCRSLSRLVSDLIDAARDATPDLTLRPRPVDLVRLVRYALRPLQAQAAEKGVEFVTPAEGERLTAQVDPVKFPWIITNIAGNAVRYTPRGGRIEVAIAGWAGGIEVTIRDTGTGIPAADLERIFEPYVSLDAEPRAGTHGLGLAIAREIVEAHGGTITAHSRVGEGTAFRIRLPRTG